jgi:enolase-phosphatase E1
MPRDTAQSSPAVQQPVAVIVCDLEGTVAPIDYVQQVLFPYVRQRLAAWLQVHAGELRVAQLLAEVAAEAGQPLDLSAAASQLLVWSDADRKIAPLKTLQGWIWQQGYASGELQAPLYPDVKPALQAWRAQGRALAVYSSGSVAAQQLFLGHSDAGDLRPLFGHWFDTAVGGKLQAASYRAIAGQLRQPAAHLLFLSDHPGEIAAAREAGWQAIQVVRDAPLPPGAIASFAELDGPLARLPQPVHG